LVLMENNRLFVKLRLPIIQRYRKLMNRIWFYINHHWGWNKTNIKYRNIMKEGHREPIINNKIVFLASGRYNDHEKYICNALMEKEEDLDIVWILDSEKECPFNARYINSNDTQKVAYELATAKIWINSNVFPIYVTKRKGQIYIQTKHWSSITLKKFYFDTPVHFKTRPYLKSVWKNDVKMYDYILVGSEFDKKTCKAGFGYKGEFLEVGSPRTDALFYSTIFKKSIIQKYNLEEDVKLLLYAPTFRAKENAREYKSEAYSVVPDFLTLCNVITKKYGGMWKVALRLHPYIDTESVDLCKNENVIDMSQYEDIQELLAVSEVVITDYSSLMFEPAMVGKKVFLFTPDIEEYCAKERDLWFDLKELPFSYARNEQELFDNIMNHEEETYQRNVKAFFDYHGVHEDGHASERAAEFILDLIKE